MAFCTQCGKELSAGLQFCPECGAAVAAGQQPAVEPASQVDPVGAQPPASSAEGTQAGQRASGPSIAAAVKDVVDAEVKRACDWCGPYHFIPGASQGLGVSTFPGMYDYMQESIDNYSKVYWAEHNL